MKGICSIKTWKRFKKSGLIHCGYIEFAIWIPLKINIENVVYKIRNIKF